MVGGTIQKRVQRLSSATGRKKSCALPLLLLRLVSSRSSKSPLQRFHGISSLQGCPTGGALAGSLPTLWVFTELILFPVLQDTSAVFCSFKIDVQREMAKMQDNFFFMPFCPFSCPHYPRTVDYFNSRNSRFCWASSSTLQRKVFGSLIKIRLNLKGTLVHTPYNVTT